MWRSRQLVLAFHANSLCPYSRQRRIFDRLRWGWLRFWDRRIRLGRIVIGVGQRQLGILG